MGERLRWLPRETLDGDELRLEQPDSAAFEAYARRLTVRNVAGMAGLFAFLSFVALLIDPLVFSSRINMPELRAMRLAHLCVLGSGLVAARSRRLRARPLTVLFPMSVLGLLTIGLYFGGQGPLDTPWVHFSYPILSCAVLPVVTLPWRAAYAVSLPTALFAGFAYRAGGLDPIEWRTPILTFTFIVTAAAVLSGEGIYRLVRRGFMAARREHRVSMALAELSRTLDDRIAAQTEELRMLVHRTEQAREDERTRVARELHDELGQELTALRYSLTFTKQRYQKDPSSVHTNLDELESLVQRTAATVRHVVSELRPAALDDLGLRGAAEALIAKVRQGVGLEVTLEAEGELAALSPDVALAAFRILQESLTNVVRHARATSVAVRLVERAGALSIRVSDDGVGLASSKKDGRPRGVGLIGIRERASALSGSARFESNDSGGTTVFVEIPNQVERAAEEQGT
ncbi:MAG: sensor histidine kinase [Polyangiaceae bacterium]